MTELISGFAQSHLGRSAFDSTPDSADPYWHQNLINQLPMVAAQWAHSQEQQMGGIHDFDIDMYHHNSPSYVHQHQFSGIQPTLVSPHMGGYPGSDIDTVGTPSSTGFPDAGEFPNALAPTPNHLQLPHRNSGGYSPHSSPSGISPRELPISSPQLLDAADRPGMIRSSTAPEQGERNSATSSQVISGIKASRNSDEDDDDFMPSEITKRGRKRQRIPHTAVERRYRENLNAHLDKLRQTVPSLAARKGPDGAQIGNGHGVKPSKCEILSGAIEHIGALNKDILDLKTENQALRAKIDQMQNWYRANSH